MWWQRAGVHGAPVLFTKKRLSPETHFFFFFLGQMLSGSLGKRSCLRLCRVAEKEQVSHSPQGGGCGNAAGGLRSPGGPLLGFASSPGVGRSGSKPWQQCRLRGSLLGLASSPPLRTLAPLFWVAEISLCTRRVVASPA